MGDVLTEVPDWPGMTHYLCVHGDEVEQLTDQSTAVAIEYALRRLESQNPGKTYRTIGRHYGQRPDVEGNPWQLFVGLQELS